MFHTQTDAKIIIHSYFSPNVFFSVSTQLPVEMRCGMKLTQPHFASTEKCVILMSCCTFFVVSKLIIYKLLLCLVSEFRLSFGCFISHTSANYFIPSTGHMVWITKCLLQQHPSNVERCNSLIAF